jgi:hypothetical protein
MSQEKPKTGAEERLGKVAETFERVGREVGDVVAALSEGIQRLIGQARSPKPATVDEDYLSDELARLEQVAATLTTGAEGLKGLSDSIPSATSGSTAAQSSGGVELQQIPGGTSGETTPTRDGVLVGNETPGSGSGSETVEAQGSSGVLATDAPASGSTPSADAGTGTDAVLVDKGLGGGGFADNEGGD